jgi:hypothetical protein
VECQRQLQQAQRHIHANVQGWRGGVSHCIQQIHME